MSNRVLRLGHLYPSLMNIYGDRGNIICLQRRCRLRGIDLQVSPLELGDTFAPGSYDLLFMGGGQDREQSLVSIDLALHKGPVLREAVEAGVPFLGVCGGYQFAGRFYRGANGEELAGAEIFDLYTLHPGPEARRLIGNLTAQWEGETLTGFENHGGRTYLGPGAEPLARVLQGFGNDGESGFEGARYKNAFGCYLHGPVLPKNPALADMLLSLALERRYGDGTLAPLDDALESQAHAAALRLR
ncbi:MAG TPA: glutamine amidotransferase [Dehalococcoidia bacterium]|nr:glutamine amidotransferase [Dehalococcoidia bacterium]